MCRGGFWRWLFLRTRHLFHHHAYHRGLFAWRPKEAKNTSKSAMYGALIRERIARGRSILIVLKCMPRRNDMYLFCPVKIGRGFSWRMAYQPISGEYIAYNGIMARAAAYFGEKDFCGGGELTFKLVGVVPRRHCVTSNVSAKPS